MPWKVTDAMDQRIRFVAELQAELASMSQLCRKYGISRKTGYKWRNRQHGSLSELRELSRRPHRSPGRISSSLERRIVALRERYPWGGKKIAVLLRREGIVVEPRTIDRVIARNGLVPPERECPKALKRFQRKSPNELWQMDFKGQYGNVFPWALMDDCSRMGLGLTPLRGTEGASTWRCIESAFRRYGLPDALLIDRGTPWWNPVNGHGLTWVSVRIIKQGVRLIVGAPRHPQTKGKIERFNRTLDQWIQHQGGPMAIRSWTAVLDDFLRVYNHVRPHEAIDMDVPSSRYWASERRYRPRPPEWEYPKPDEVHRLTPSGTLRYKRSHHFVCEALGGENVWCQEYGDTVLVTYRCMLVREINLRDRRTYGILKPVN